jgi:hypothetical protein
VIPRGGSIYGELIGYLWEFPLTVFFLVRFVATGELWNLAGAAISSVGHFICKMCGAARAKRILLRQALDYLALFSTASYERVSRERLATVLDEGTRQLLCQGPSPLMSRERATMDDVVEAYIVRCPESPAPLEIKAYPVPGGPVYVFLLDPPEKMGEVQRFKLYHEIGHTYQVASWFYSRMYSSRLVTFTTLFCIMWIAIVISRLNLSLWIWSMFAIAALIRERFEIEHMKQTMEAAADLFAAKRLAGGVDLVRIIHHYRRFLPEGDEKELRIKSLEVAQQNIRNSQPEQIVDLLPCPSPATLLFATLPLVVVALSEGVVVNFSAVVWVFLHTVLLPLWFFYNYKRLIPRLHSQVGCLLIVRTVLQNIVSRRER